MITVIVAKLTCHNHFSMQQISLPMPWLPWPVTFFRPKITVNIHLKLAIICFSQRKSLRSLAGCGIVDMTGIIVQMNPIFPTSSPHILLLVNLLLPPLPKNGRRISFKWSRSCVACILFLIRFGKPWCIYHPLPITWQVFTVLLSCLNRWIHLFGMNSWEKRSLQKMFLPCIIMIYLSSMAILSWSK